MKFPEPVNEFAVTIWRPMGRLPHAKQFAKCNSLGYCADMKHFTAILILIIAAFVSLSAQAQSTPDGQYVAIYMEIQQADSLLAAGQTQQALDTYTRAGQRLEQFQKVFPEWNPKIVKFRLNYLAQKISDLTAKIPAPSKTPAATNAPPTSAPQPSETTTATDVNALQAQIKSLQDQNADLQAKLKEALSAQPAEANPQELEMARAQIKSLLKENDLLRASAASQTSAPPVSAKTKELQKSLAETKQKLLEQTERADKLAQNNQALQAKLQPLLANADALQALREENAALKKQAAAKAGNGRGNELEKLRAQVAALQSDADVHWLERAALENRLRQLQLGAGTNAATETGTSDFSATYHATPDVNQTETATTPANQIETATVTSSTNQMTSEETTNMPQTTATPETGALKNAENNSAGAVPANATDLAAEAQNYFAAHQYDKAEADYEKILQRDPNNSVALANLAAIEMEENKLADAETHLQAALKQNPNNAYNLSLKGYLKFRQGNYGEALGALTRAARMDPKNAQIQNYLGVTLSHEGRTADAEAALLKAIKLNPDYAAAHNNLAVIYINENPPKSELARVEYQKAIADGQPRNDDLEKLLATKGAPVADGK